MSVDRSHPWGKPFSDAPSLIAQAEAQVEKEGDTVFLTWLNGKGKVETEITFRGMWERAGALGREMLNSWGLARGDCVMLCYSPGPEFFGVFWACLRAGVIAVPVYPPSPDKLAQALAKLELIRAACSASTCLTDKAVNWLRHTSSIMHTWPRGLTWRVTEGLDFKTTSITGDLHETPIVADDLAFLQFTSGSTGDPKGVMITHGNLWSNVNDFLIPHNEHQCDVFGQPKDERRVMLTWLPQYHDLGLIYAHIAPFLGSIATVNMSPVTFLTDPNVWLKAASEFRAHFLVSPDFGYRLATRRFLSKPVEKRPTFDLSSLHSLGTCAERIRPDTMEAFAEAFQQFGLRAKTVGGYGLAEHVVCVGGFIDEVGLTRSRTRPDLAASAKEFVGVVKIVNPESREEVEEGKPGEIWCSSGSVATGYWGKPELSEETFRARLAGDDGSGCCFLRTGDEGYLEDGALFICGRIKDMVIVAGENYYPEDIEIAAQSAAGNAIRPGCIAAFAVDSGESEELVVVFEIRQADTGNAQAVCSEISSAVLRETKLKPSRLVAIKEKTIAKTTSGKIRRRATRDALFEEELFVVHDTRPPPKIEPEASKAPRSKGNWWWTCCTSEDVNAEVPAIIRVNSSASRKSKDMAPPLARAKSRDESIFGDISEESSEASSPTLELVRAALKEVLDEADVTPVTPETETADLGLSSMQWSQFAGSLGDAGIEGIDLSTMMMLGTVGEIVHELDRLRAGLGQPEGPTKDQQEAADRQPSRREFVKTLPLLEERALPLPLVLLIQTLGLFLPVVQLFLTGTLMFYLGNEIYAYRGETIDVIALLPLIFLAATMMMLLGVWLLRLCLFPYGLRQGRFKIYGWTHLRGWLLDRVLMFIHTFFAPSSETPVYNMLLIALGAKVEAGARIAQVASFSNGLLSVGAGSSISGSLSCHVFMDGELVLAEVKIGCAAAAASHSYINPGTTMRNAGQLGRCSVLVMGSTVEAGAIWAGNPAVRVGKTMDLETVQVNTQPDFLKLFYGLLIQPFWYGGLVFIGIQVFTTLREVLETALGTRTVLVWFPCLTLAVWSSCLAVLLTFVVGKWVLLGRIREGEQTPFFCARARILHLLLSSVFEYVKTLPDGLQLLALRAVGASVAKDTFLCDEALLRCFKCADLCSIGSGVFVGGSGDILFEAGTTWHRISLAEGSYIGTFCLLDVGCSLQKGAGIGAYSYLPPNTEVPAETLFVGNPAHRMASLSEQGVQRFPQLRRWSGWFCHYMLYKTIFKFFMIQPTFSVPIFYFWAMELFHEHVSPEVGKPVEVLAQVLLGAVAFFAGLLLMLLFSRATLGLRWKARRPEVEELRFGFLSFSGYCWLFEQYATQAFFIRWMYALRGTLWMRLILRALGARVGHNTFIDEGKFYEPWLVTAEDDVTMQTGCKPCPHSLEMNGDVLLRRVRLCQGSTLLDGSTVHGGGVLPQGALLGTWSRPFSGQRLEPGREYHSSPCTVVPLRGHDQV